MEEKIEFFFLVNKEKIEMLIYIYPRGVCTIKFLLLLFVLGIFKFLVSTLHITLFSGMEDATRKKQHT